MSFVEIYNEQLFDLLLSPEACPSRSQQQRRFNVYGGNGSERAARGKRNAPVCSAQKLVTETVGAGGESALPTPPKQAPELVIYERPDGCTYVKVKRGVLLIGYEQGTRLLRQMLIVIDNFLQRLEYIDRGITSPVRNS